MAEHPLAALLALRLLPGPARDRAGWKARRFTRRGCARAIEVAPPLGRNVANRRPKVLDAARAIERRGGRLGRRPPDGHSDRIGHPRMKVLVVGSGAREHALVWKCVQSDLVERVYCAPGNGGTGGMARNVAIGAADVVRLVDFAKRERLGLVILGPEAAVDAGVGDALRSAGFNVFGPNRGAGRIESSKAYAKALMQRANIPTAEFEVFTEPAPAKAWAKERGGRVAVKADGLALGKGVIVCSSAKESDAAIEAMLVEGRFGRSGATIVVEELLVGPELTVMGVTDGKDVVALAPARDFKRAHEGDAGPNTGGMGAYSPPMSVDDALVRDAVDRVIRPAVRELSAGGDEFRGVLYAGLMLTEDGLRTIEFNARLGDPEAQVVLPRLP